MIVLPYKDKHPKLAESAFVAPNAAVIGDVTVGDRSSIWFGATVRGDVMPIEIGSETSIQDGVTVHATGGWSKTVVGDRCVVGHNAILHGCKVEDGALIGMGAIVLDGAVIREGSVVGAGAVVTARKEFPARSLILGSPAKAVREVSDADTQGIAMGAAIYVEKTAEYRAILAKRSDD